ncbi:MAG: carboxypeptidase-like regulatory domain-containing protein [Bacteroidales bacterium]|nr:carboxypeptidase-like regulatory domain-containing protein [Bacteroidales bacterium]
MKLVYRIVFFSFIACLTIHSLYSQKVTQSPGYVSGRIIDSDVSKGISFVHVLNESQRLSVLSDTSGRFTIRAGLNDTLVFSVIGYLGKFIVLDKSTMNGDIEILLAPRYYEIAEVEVFGITSYSKFREKFRKTEIPKTETDILRSNLQAIAIDIGQEAKYYLSMKKAAEGGNLMAAPILSPEEKQRLKLKEMMNKESIQYEIDKKYNRQVVADLTGLKDQELDEFMLYCKFSQKFLQFSSQYEILVKVLEKYEQYKELKKKSSIQTYDNYALNTNTFRYTGCV